MKPRELYSGQAPAAISMMGQGLMEAGANIGKMNQQGWSALGQGIASGISGYAQQSQEKKKLEAQNKADAGFYDSMKPYFSDETRAKFDAQQQAIESDPRASALDKAAFYHSAKSYLGQLVQQDMAMQRIREENLGRKEIALTTGMIPYVFPPKGSAVSGVDQFIDPGFIGSKQPGVLDNPTLKSSYETFQKEVPGGTPDQFAAWQTGKIEELKKKAAANKIAPDLTISPY